MKKLLLNGALGLLVISTNAVAGKSEAVADSVIIEQRAALIKNTAGKGFGPQAPRDIGSLVGTNSRVFGAAPSYAQMNLCNIHFHKNAEHKGGDFTKYAGNGDGQGYHSGYQYSGVLSAAELTKLDSPVGSSAHGSLYPGDTIEVHYVHSTAQVSPGATLGACLSDAIGNPQLRVVAQVFVLVNDASAGDFTKLAQVAEVNGYHQAPNIPANTGKAIEYSGSTTGPGYNEAGSPFQVSWSVRPSVAKVSIESVGVWLEGNAFDEDHAHGVRNLVINPELLSEIR